MANKKRLLCGVGSSVLPVERGTPESGGNPMNILRCFVAVAAAGVLGAGAAFAETITFDPPAEGFSEAKPAYLHFKEITAERKSSKEIVFTYVLYGSLPEEPPANLGIRYRVYFDVDGMTTESAQFKRGDFIEDIRVTFYRKPNVRDFRIFSEDWEFQGKDWSMQVVKNEMNGDTIRFTLRSKLFAESKLRVRMAFTAAWIPLDSKIDKLVAVSPIRNLPPRGQGPDIAISERLGGQ